MESLEVNMVKESEAICGRQINAANYYKKLIAILQQMNLSPIDDAVNLIRKAWQEKKQIICFGNGGSALTAQHFINDWNKSIFLSSGRSFRGRCLTENVGLITAYANDLSYQDIFVEQLKNILEPGDLVIGISGSGNSENVLRAITYANEQSNVTIGLCGFNGGRVKQIAQHVVWAICFTLPPLNPHNPIVTLLCSFA